MHSPRIDPISRSAYAFCRGDVGSISDPHGANTSDEYLTIGSIAVAHEIARSLVPSTGLSKLPGDPFCGWMRGGPQRFFYDGRNLMLSHFKRARPRSLRR